MLQNLENTVFFKYCIYKLPAPTLEVTADTVLMVWLQAWDNVSLSSNKDGIFHQPRL